jgi:hypothetical protein
VDNKTPNIPVSPTHWNPAFKMGKTPTVLTNNPLSSKLIFVKGETWVPKPRVALICVLEANLTVQITLHSQVPVLSCLAWVKRGHCNWRRVLQEGQTFHLKL